MTYSWGPRLAFLVEDGLFKNLKPEILSLVVSSPWFLGGPGRLQAVGGGRRRIMDSRFMLLGLTYLPRRKQGSTLGLQNQCRKHPFFGGLKYIQRPYLWQFEASMQEGIPPDGMVWPLTWAPTLCFLVSVGSKHGPLPGRLGLWIADMGSMVRAMGLDCRLEHEA